MMWVWFALGAFGLLGWIMFAWGMIRSMELLEQRITTLDNIVRAVATELREAKEQR